MAANVTVGPRQKRKYGRLSAGIGTASNQMDKAVYEMFSRQAGTQPSPVAPPKKSMPVTPNPMDQMAAARNAMPTTPPPTQVQNPAASAMAAIVQQMMSQPATASPVPGAPGGPAGAPGAYTGSVGGDKYRTAMASGILKAIGADPSNANAMNFMLAWMQAEGTAAQYNPLGTTQQMAGSYALPGNSAGVQQYPSMQLGIEAIKRTLLNGRYNEIVQGLRQGVNPLQLARSPELGTWVTGTPNTIGRNQYIYAVLASSQGKR